MSAKTWELKLVDPSGTVVETWDVRRVKAEEWDEPEFVPPCVSVEDDDRVDLETVIHDLPLYVKE